MIEQTREATRPSTPHPHHRRHTEYHLRNYYTAVHFYSPSSTHHRSRLQFGDCRNRLHRHLFPGFCRSQDYMSVQQYSGHHRRHIRRKAQILDSIASGRSRLDYRFYRAAGDYSHCSYSHIQKRVYVSAVLRPFILG